jgi:protein-disulfide isomerase
LALAGVSLLFDVWLLAIQAFSIGAFCRLCLATYAFGLAGFIALLPARNALGRLAASLARGDGRLVVTGWLIASLGFGAAVMAAESELKQRERMRAASILGSPAPAATSQPDLTAPTPAAATVDPPPVSAPAPTLAAAPAASPPAAASPAAGSPAPSPAAAGTEIERARAEAQAARAEAKRLQETLDDPKKLDAYFTAKASREFDEAKPQTLGLEGVPHKGPAEAPIKAVEYSDFLCPYCRSLAAAFAGFQPQTGGKLAIYFKNYPLEQSCNPGLSTTVHPGACWLALGAVCAVEQGKFWEYHDKVFSIDPLANPQAADVVRIGESAGLDPGSLASCIHSTKAKERLGADIAEARRVGVQSTPTVFINGRRLPRINDFVAAADKEASRLGLPPLSKPAQR